MILNIVIPALPATHQINNQRYHISEPNFEIPEQNDVLTKGTRDFILVI